jgi:hypothetical protein
MTDPYFVGGIERIVRYFGIDHRPSVLDFVRDAVMKGGKSGRKRRPSSSTKGGSNAKPKAKDIDVKKVWAAAPKRGEKPKTFGASSSRED